MMLVINVFLKCHKLLREVIFLTENVNICCAYFFVATIAKEMTILSVCEVCTNTALFIGEWLGVCRSSNL